MPETEIFAIARSLERLIVVWFAGLSIVLGWNLFRVRMVRDQSADFSTKTLRIKLTRVAPGIFFALFGMSGLIYAIARPLDMKQVAASVSEHSANGATRNEISYGAGTAQDDITRIRAINTLSSVCSTCTGSPTPADIAAKNAALEVLTRLKKQLLIAHFGKNYDWYQQLKDASLSNPSRLSSLTAAERERFDTIDDEATSVLK